MKRSGFLLLSILCICNLINADDEAKKSNNRFLDTSVNLGCELIECKQFSNDSSDLSIVYVRSSKFKKNNTKSGLDIHFILSTYGGSPAFIIASTKNDSNIKIDWTKLFKKEKGSIKFLENNKEIDVNNTIGILIDRMFMWLDANEDAKYEPGKKMIEKEIEPSKMKWTNATILEQSNEGVHVEFKLKEKYGNGTIRLRLMISTKIERYGDLPRLLFTPKSIHTQLVFDGFEDFIENGNYTNRLGLQLTTVTTGVKGEMKPRDRFDDEESPGLFTTLKYPFGQKLKDESFLSFKPNAYTSSDRLISQTIDIKYEDMITGKKEVFQQNNAFFGFYNNTNNDYNVYQIQLTFGSKGQEFYSKTNHTEFNFVFGLNDLPEPEMSLFIKLVIIIGSGLSLLVLIIFPISICLMTKQMRRRRESGLLANQESIY